MTAKQIIAIRRRMGLSRRGFADLFGLTQHAIGAWERGENTPSGPSRKMLEVMNGRKKQ